MATNNTNEPGIIGQQYEHRKTHKIGVLESRETKYKTLMFRDKDGGSFTTTYSTFRSDWRKYQGDDVVAQTSTQVEDTKDEKKDSKESSDKEEKKLSKRAKQTVDKEAVEADTQEAINLINTTLEKMNKEFTVKLGGRGNKMNCARVKNGKKNIFEIWMQGDVFEFFTNKEVWDVMKFPEKFGEVDVEIHESFNLKYKAVFNKKALQAVIKVAVAAI